MAILFAIASSVVYGVADFSGGFAARRAPAVTVVVTSDLAGLGVLVIVAPLMGGSPTMTDLLWGMAAGGSGVISVVVFYRGLAAFRIGVVAPVASLVSAVGPVTFGVVVGERPASLAWVGIGVAIPAIGLIASGHGADDAARLVRRLGLWYGLAAGAGFALFFILISRVGEDSGVWPLVSARMASLPVMVAVAVAMRRPLIAGRSAAPSAVLAGVGAVVANAFFLLATREGLLAVASVVVGLYPASTLVLARTLLGERIEMRQGIGLGLAALSIGFIAVA